MLPMPRDNTIHHLFNLVMHPACEWSELAGQLRIYPRILSTLNALSLIGFPFDYITSNPTLAL